MTDDLFPGFASHWIDTEAGRIFARARATARPSCSCTASRRPTSCGIGSRRRSPRRTRWSAWTCAATAGPPSRGAIRPTRPTPSAPWAATWWPSWRRSVTCASPSSATTAARGSATGSPSTSRAGSSGWRCSTSCPTFEVWRRIRRRAIDAAHWGFLSRPTPEPETEIVRDPIPYFHGLWWSGGRRRHARRLRPARARRLPGRLGDPSRIHARCEDYRAGATRDVEADERDLAAGQADRLPDPDRLGHLLPHPAAAPRRRSTSGGRVLRAEGDRRTGCAAGTSWPRRTRTGRWRSGAVPRRGLTLPRGSGKGAEAPHAAPSCAKAQ